MQLYSVSHLTNPKKRQLFFTKQASIDHHQKIPLLRRSNYYLEDYWLK
jgi:hypothetical protein